MYPFILAKPIFLCLQRCHIQIFFWFLLFEDFQHYLLLNFRNFLQIFEHFAEYRHYMLWEVCNLYSVAEYAIIHWFHQISLEKRRFLCFAFQVYHISWRINNSPIFIIVYNFINRLYLDFFRNEPGYVICVSCEWRNCEIT